MANPPNRFLDLFRFLLRRWVFYLVLAGLTVGTCLATAPTRAALPGNPSSPTHVSVLEPLEALEPLPGGAAPSLIQGALAEAKPPAIAQADTQSDTQSNTQSNTQATTQEPLEQGYILYRAGRYAEAARTLEAAVEAALTPRQEAIALRNLSLVYQALGRWEEAETSITRSLDMIRGEAEPDSLALAQVLDVLGQFEFYHQGADAALATWEEAARLYDETGDEARATQAQLNQAKALQAMGFYQQAIALLNDLQVAADNQPDSPEQVERLRSLGNAQRVAGDLENAWDSLNASLEMANRLQLAADARAAIHEALGGVAYTRGNFEPALARYDTAIALATAPRLQVQINLNRLRTLLALARPEPALELASALQDAIEALPLSRFSIEARINLGDSWLQLAQLQQPSPALNEAASLLAIAVQQSRELGDRRSESYALGTLGKAYEQANQWNDAKPLTIEALQLVQAMDFPELRYLWEWQLGRILKQQDNRQGAIASYSNAIETLRAVRRDLAAINPEAQFSFRESIEPIHRELVSLLLAPDANPTDEELEKARFTIESLQLAELDNFFREACLDAESVEIDNIDQQAAVLYPILLPDRLEIILAIPNAPLQHYPVPVSEAEVGLASREFLRQVRNSRSVVVGVQLAGAQFYDWLVRPVEQAIADSGLKTLVFVPDGVLRNLPLATLYDGEQYLIEKYGVAIAPTLQLLEAGPLRNDSLTALMGGLSESVQGFTPLPGVESELEQLQDIIAADVILNTGFTNEAIAERIREVPFPIVHLATHGEFSSNVEDTYILTYSDRLNINELRQLLQSADVERGQPIELLVLSACRTALGDDRAALGLAGVAVRSGARSTIASLWYVSDDATFRLMVALYANLSRPGISKAEALRQAQIALINGETEFVVGGGARGPTRTVSLGKRFGDVLEPISQELSHPYYWGAFTLVGNWQ